MFLGFFLYHLDHLIYCLFGSPYELSSQRVKSYFDQKLWQQAFRVLNQTESERTKTIFHSVVFQMALVLAGFFVLTSSSSLLGKGVILGLLFHSILDQGLNLIRKQGIGDWFWQIKTAVPERMQKTYFFFILIVFLLLATYFV